MDLNSFKYSFGGKRVLDAVLNLRYVGISLKSS